MGLNNPANNKALASTKTKSYIFTDLIFPQPYDTLFLLHYRIKKDFGTITTSLGVSKTDVNQNVSLVLVSAMVTTSIRSLWVG